MRGDQSSADVLCDPQGTAHVHGALVTNVLRQVGTVDLLHDQEPQVPLDPSVVQGGHVRMVDLRSGHGLALEPPWQVRMRRLVQYQRLDRHIAVQHPVPAGPHLAHPAAPEPLDQLVPPRDQVSALHLPPPMTKQCRPSA
nr:hypothetical protein [Streptomyces triticagri]